MKYVLIAVAIAFVAVLIGICGAGMWFTGIYNSLVAEQENVKGSWSQVENVYQRRADLIPNLVETVKGYAAHERETLEAVVQARAQATQTNINPQNAGQMQAFMQSQGELSSALSRLMVVVEAYPNLKANENFLALQNQLEGTENRITVERQRYNQAAQSFNTRIRSLPDRFVASMLNMEAFEYFQAQPGAETVPQVDFGTAGAEQ